MLLASLCLGVGTHLPLTHFGMSERTKMRERQCLLAIMGGIMSTHDSYVEILTPNTSDGLYLELGSLRSDKVK